MNILRCFDVQSVPVESPWRRQDHLITYGSAEGLNDVLIYLSLR